MIYTFIARQCTDLPVATCCRVMKVSTSGFYKWRKCPVTDRDWNDAVFTNTIVDIHRMSRRSYGSPRVHAELVLGLDTPCSLGRVERLMRQARIQGIYRRRGQHGCTRRDGTQPSDDLVGRKFDPDAPNQLWVMDVTEHRTGEGKVYLAAVLDAYSRRVVGWSTRATIHREVVLDAVLMAVRRRRPRRTLIHSDQGTQYGSDAWRRFCKANHLEPSMSRRGNCWDNAVAESFFSILKKERIKKQIYHDRDTATKDIAEYIELFYNRTRRHRHIGGISPERFEAEHRRSRNSVH